MIEVLVVGVWLVMLWFGFWIPVLLSISEAAGIPRWAAWVLSPLGPLGAFVVLGMSVVGRRSG